MGLHGPTMAQALVVARAAARAVASPKHATKINCHGVKARVTVRARVMGAMIHGHGGLMEVPWDLLPGWPFLGALSWRCRWCLDGSRCHDSLWLRHESPRHFHERTWQFVKVHECPRNVTAAIALPWEPTALPSQCHESPWYASHDPRHGEPCGRL